MVIFLNFLIRSYLSISLSFWFLATDVITIIHNKNSFVPVELFYMIKVNDILPVHPKKKGVPHTGASLQLSFVQGVLVPLHTNYNLIELILSYHKNPSHYYISNPRV